MKLTENAKKILNSRYLRKSENGDIIDTPENMIQRVAMCVANVERKNGISEEKASQFEHDVYTMLDNIEFLPNSPTLMNAGSELAQLAACFVLKVEDSIESIYDRIKQSAIIFKSGGGVGFSFSALRPTNDFVGSTSGVSSGPVSFMNVFNSSIQAIKQGGKRRGAAMAVLSVEHPDIMEFITCKDKEGEMANFNVSVAITNKFIEAVRNNTSYDLINPKNKKIVKSINARDVFTAIVDHAWKNGEPGVLFIDHINRTNPLIKLGAIESTNPCMTGDTPILTDKGYYRIDSVVGNKVKVWNGEEFSEVTPMETGKNQKIIRVEFSDGSHVDCTPYHSFYIEKETDVRRSKVEKIEAKYLKSGMKLERFEYPILTGYKVLRNKEAYTRGVFSGDGYVAMGTDRKDRNMISLYGEKKHIKPYLMYESCGNEDGYKVYLTLENENGIWDKTFVPSAEYSLKTRLDWLAGLLDTDAGSNGNGSYSIWSIDRDFLVDVKMMLHTIGIGGTLSLGTKAGNKNMPNGKGGQKEYQTQDCWRLTISGFSISKLVKLGLKTHRVDTSYIPTREAQRLIQIVSVKSKGVVDTVYCFTEPKRHKGMFGSVVIGQCGEVPLMSGESCVLGSINLGKLIFNKEIDWDRLKELVKLGTRFLDNVIDANKYPLAEIEEITKKNRKIGLGIMGWQDMLVQLGVSYDSEEALELAEKIMSFINLHAEAMSEELATERGAFPNYENSTYTHKRRNATLTTIAPTGSIGSIANASTGIEPYFGLIYTKENVLGGTTLYEIIPLFEPYIAMYGLDEKDLQTIKREGSVKNISKLPQEIRNLFRTSHDISPEMHIRMQSAFQKYTENSISKTINMPEQATQDDVWKAYMLAFDLGCKGLTIYRNNSRNIQVLNLDKKPLKELKDIKEIDVPRVTRPRKQTSDVLSGQTYPITTGCGKLRVTINDDNSRPHEVLLTLGKSGACATSQTECIGKLISLCLQADIPIEEILHRMKGIRCDHTMFTQNGVVLSCADAVAKALEDYLSDNGQDLKIESITDFCPDCPECGQKLVKNSGCTNCPSCGYSKCE